MWKKSLENYISDKIIKTLINKNASHLLYIFLLQYFSYEGLKIIGKLIFIFISI